MTAAESANASAPTGSAQRIGILGGTFDPIHNGHLLAAQRVANQLGLQKVIFVPAGNQWQKAHQTPAAHRLAMTKIATAEQPQFEVSAVDVDRGGATYTVDTLTDLAKQNPGAELYFILGTDAWSGIKSWKNWQALGALAKFVVVTRPGFAVGLDDVEGLSAERVNIDAIDLSSTECRSRAMAGESLAGLVPERVITYIRDQNLYQEAE